MRAVLLICGFLGFLSINPCYSQCPANLDFELGDFTGWTLYTGSATTGGIDLYPTGYSANQHKMLNAVPGAGLDRYGHFPQNCPNGSGHSIKLGNIQTGAGAEGASYTFTIPATQNQFRLTYYYAVVLQNPNHLPSEQPSMQVEVRNVTDNTTSGCSSFNFIAGALPDWEISDVDPTVTFRNWSANSINLDGNAGKTIEIFFKTADCTKGGHFGYAYIDLNTGCDGTFPGASFCPADPSVSVTAPYGYAQYQWTDPTYSTTYGISQNLTLTPPPAAGTIVKVILTPFPGYGCTDTLTTALTPDLPVIANAGPDKTLCNSTSVQIGVPPTDGIIYRWTPTTGLSNPNISNPVATTFSTITYALTASSPGFGCNNTDQVTVFQAIDKTLTLKGSNPYCIGSGTSPTLSVLAGPAVQWYQDGAAIPGATSSSLNVTQSGDYKAELTSPSCTLFTEIIHVDVYPKPAANFTVNNSSQCFSVNDFAFTDANPSATGLSYAWDFGDGKTSNVQNPSHSYVDAGNYTVILKVTGTGGCTATDSHIVTVLPNAKPDFSITPKCINLASVFTNTSVVATGASINYLWDFGNGMTSAQFEPYYAYPASGTYTVRLSTTSSACPIPEVKDISIEIDEPAVNTRYADQTAVINFPEKLYARNIGNSALWNPATKLNNDRTYTPYFKSDVPQEYTITLTTKTGCVTVDTLLVKTIRKIEIHVPTAFTPNGDGLNDVLKPLLFGFSKVNYFRIYNRWGKLIFESNDDQKGWNGKIGDTPLDIQSVIWMISAVDVDGVTHTEKGMTTIMR